jgi:hypothetical protein
MVALVATVGGLVVAGYLRVAPCVDLGVTWERALLLPPLGAASLVGGAGAWEALRPGTLDLVPGRVLRRQVAWAVTLALLSGTVGFLQHLTWAWESLANCRATAPAVLEGVLLLDAVPTLLGGIVLVAHMVRRRVG